MYMYFSSAIRNTHDVLVCSDAWKQRATVKHRSSFSHSCYTSGLYIVCNDIFNGKWQRIRDRNDYIVLQHADTLQHTRCKQHNDRWNSLSVFVSLYVYERWWATFANLAKRRKQRYTFNIHTRQEPQDKIFLSIISIVHSHKATELANLSATVSQSKNYTESVWLLCALLVFA